MIANYHTHTRLCNHAIGTPHDYVETAISNELKILGFSDHVPYPFKNGYYSNYRMAVNETEKYVSEISSLKSEFKGKIKIYTGYETEFYPAEFNRMLKNIEKYGYDYLILGQHFTDNEYDGYYSGFHADEDILKRYVDQVIEALKTNLFSYVAHPDLINYQDDINVYKREMSRLCEASLLLDIPLEFNCLGLIGNRNYPNDEFWKIVSDAGCKTIIGCDAHEPRFTGNNEIYNKAFDKLKEFGIKPIDIIKFKKG